MAHWRHFGATILKITGAAVGVSYLITLGVFQTAMRRRVAALEVGSRVATTAAGPVEYALEGNGPTVLILPGTFGGYDQALQIGRDLIRAGFRVLAVSRPGYLRTPIEVGRTPAEQADAIAMLIDSLRLGRVSVVAVSGGGPAALELAHRHPATVTHLVLIAGLTGPKAQPPTRATRLTEITNRLFGQGFLTWWQLLRYQASGTRALDSPIFGADSRRRLTEDPEKLDQFFRLAWFRFPPARRSAGYLNDRAQFASFAFSSFDAITTPTLVVHGTADRNAPIEHGDRAAAGIPGAEYLRIEGGDHYSSIARAEEVSGRVTKLLRRVTPNGVLPVGPPR